MFLVANKEIYLGLLLSINCMNVRLVMSLILSLSIII